MSESTYGGAPVSQLTKVRIGRPIVRVTAPDGTVTDHLCPEQELPPAPTRSRTGAILGVILAMLVTAAMAHALGAGPGGVLLASSVVPIAFKQMLLDGRAWKAALYVGAANLSNSTSGYATANEVVGAGYVAGGLALVAHVIQGADGVSIILDFDDLSWAAASFTARYIFVYDNNAPGQAGFVVDMGQDQQVSGGTFQIIWPDPDISTAILVLA